MSGYVQPNLLNRVSRGHFVRHVTVFAREQVEYPFTAMHLLRESESSRCHAPVGKFKNIGIGKILMEKSTQLDHLAPASAESGKNYLLSLVRQLFPANTLFLAADPRTPEQAARRDSMASNSMRYPRIFTCVSMRPWQK